MSDERVSTEIKVSTVVAVITDHLHKKEEGRIRCVCVALSTGSPIFSTLEIGESESIMAFKKKLYECVLFMQTYPWKYKRLAGVLITGLEGKFTYTNQLQQISSEEIKYLS